MPGTLSDVDVRLVLAVEHVWVENAAARADWLQELLSLWCHPWLQGLQDCQANLPLDGQAGGAGVIAETLWPIY